MSLKTESVPTRRGNMEGRAGTVCYIIPGPASWRFSLQFDTFPETEADMIVHVIQDARLKSIEPYFESIHDSGQIQLLLRIKKIFCERVFIEVGAEGLNGFHPGWDQTDGTGCLYPPDLFPRGGGHGYSP